jgi:hypothetical protein
MTTDTNNIMKLMKYMKPLLFGLPTFGEDAGLMTKN